MAHVRNYLSYTCHIQPAQPEASVACHNILIINNLQPQLQPQKPAISLKPQILSGRPVTLYCCALLDSCSLSLSLFLLIIVPLPLLLILLLLLLFSSLQPPLSPHSIRLPVATIIIIHWFPNLSSATTIAHSSIIDPPLTH